jgi:uncharacterized protein YggE
MRVVNSMELNMRKSVFALSLSAAMLTCVEAKAQPVFQPQPAGRSVLTVEGNGKAKAKPEYARLMVDVPAKATTLEGAVEASKTLLPRVDALLQSLKGEGLEIESSHFELGENPRPPQTPSAPSFTATTGYALKVDKLDHLDSIVGRIASLGSVEIRTASFHVRDERAALDEARRDAVADARHQADTIADAAGVRLDEIASISDVRASPRLVAEAAARLSVREYAQIIPPAALDFNASIVMAWRISPKP